MRLEDEPKGSTFGQRSDLGFQVSTKLRVRLARLPQQLRQSRHGQDSFVIIRGVPGLLPGVGPFLNSAASLSHIAHLAFRDRFEVTQRSLGGPSVV